MPGCKTCIRQTNEGIPSGALRPPTSSRLATHCAPSELPRCTAHHPPSNACAMPATLHRFRVGLARAADSRRAASPCAPCSAAPPPGFAPQSRTFPRSNRRFSRTDDRYRRGAPMWQPWPLAGRKATPAVGRTRIAAVGRKATLLICK